MQLCKNMIKHKAESWRRAERLFLRSLPDRQVILFHLHNGIDYGRFDACGFEGIGSMTSVLLRIAGPDALDRDAAVGDEAGNWVSEMPGRCR